MKHPEKRSRRVTILVLVLLALLGGRVSRSGESRKSDRDDRLQAVYDYVNKTCTNLSEAQRDEIEKGSLVREIKGWPLQDKIVQHRLFVFPRGASFNRGAVLVAVTGDLVPFKLHDSNDVNELLQKEGIRILDAQEAGELAEFFLRAYAVSNIYDYGYESGLNVVRSFEDIPFNRSGQKAALEKAFKIEPPKVIATKNGFRYVAYTWDKFNTGRLEKQELSMNSKGIQGFTTSLLKAGVGKWEANR